MEYLTMHMPTTSSLLQSLQYFVEPGLLLVFAAIFHGKRMQRRFPAVNAYLALKLIGFCVLQYAASVPGSANVAYFSFADRFLCVIGAILAFFAWMEIYRDAMKYLPGIARFGTLAFRWAAAASVLITVSTILPLHSSPHIFADMAAQLPRSISTIELCLVAFLALSLKSIGISFRSRNFGLTIGFAIMAAGDFVRSVQNLPQMATTSAWVLNVLALVIWIIYSLLPEPKLQMSTIPVNSTLYRWNEIAMALGQKGAQVVTVQQQASLSSFFLSDVEKAVEQAFNRTLKNSETE